MKVCNRCHEESEFYPSICQPCKKCWKVQSNLWYNGIDPKTGLTNGKLAYHRNREQRLLSMKVYREDLRKEVIGHYSNGSMSCECCGEDEPKFLALDHIVPVGRGCKGKTRDGQHRSGLGLYAWIKRNDFPTGFRVLCHNCNLGRSINGGRCPHKDPEVCWEGDYATFQ